MRLRAIYSVKRQYLDIDISPYAIRNTYLCSGHIKSPSGSVREARHRSASCGYFAVIQLGNPTKVSAKKAILRAL